MVHRSAKPLPSSFDTETMSGLGIEDAGKRETRAAFHAKQAAKKSAAPAKSAPKKKLAKAATPAK